MDDELARSTARQLRNTILRALGLGTPLLVSPACGSSSPSDGDEGGVTTNPSGGDEDPDGDGSSDDGDPDGDDADEPKLDVNLKFDVPQVPKDCWRDWFWGIRQLPPEFSSCDFGPLDPALDPVYLQICVPLPEGGSCEDICLDTLCEGMESCVDGPIWSVCGPLEIDGECCVMIATEQPPPVGRPFIVAGHPRLATAPELQAPLAAHWLETARGEHASIAAFARFVATLLRFAAPARLLADALAAARDECHHTRDALALASRFADRPLALGGLAIADALHDSDELALALAAAVREGCVAETLAAHEAACLAAEAEDPQVAAVLGKIADDEARHAALAWRFVAWVLDTRPELRGVIERAFATELGAVPARHELGLRELIRPCVEALLSRRTARGRSTAPASRPAPASPR